MKLQHEYPRFDTCTLRCYYRGIEQRETYVVSETSVGLAEPLRSGLAADPDPHCEPRPAKEVPIPAIGEIAPDLELTSDRGGKVRLSDFRGKKVILYFFPKAGTKG